MKRALQLIVIAALLVAVIPSASAKKQPPISWSSCNTTADKPGRTYLMSTAMTCGAGVDGITITANNVTVDLGGLELTGPNAGSMHGVTIANGVSGARIKHGTITQFADGIDGGVTTTGTVVSAVNIVQNIATGILLGPGSTVRSSRVVENGGIGIEMDGTGTGAAFVTTTFVSRNGSDGIDITFLSAGLVDHSYLSHNAQRGVFMAAHKGIVRRTTAVGNATAGVEMNGSTTNTADRIHSASNGSNGILIDNAGTAPTVTRSSVLASGGDGIRVDTPGGSATITSNVSDGNGADGIHVAAALPATVDGNTTNANGWATVDGANFGINSPDGHGHNHAAANDTSSNECTDDTLC